MSFKYNNPLTECPCGCGSRVIVADTEPIYEGDERFMRVCVLPNARLISMAMERLVQANAEAAKDSTSITPDLMLMEVLLDGYLASMEVLSRISTHSRYTSGDDFYDDEEIEGAVELAQDMVTSLTHADVAEGAPKGVRIDLAYVAVELGMVDHNDDDNDTTIN